MDIRKYIILKTMAVAVSAAAAISSNDKTATIRVLLMTDGYKSYYHQDAEYVINEKTDSFIVPSIHRDGGIPEYKGKLNVAQTDKGYLLINEVDIEEYVKGVVPSEMPSSYEMEALKAQAICARTYAYRQLLDHKLAAYNADVDDSVSFQVYQNQSIDPKTSEAVDATKGLIMTYDNKPIESYFFSTSSGSTSTDEVWGTESAPCLKSIITTYDENMPWYRWQVFFSNSKVQTLLKNAGYEIGEIQNIQILKKSQGGAAVACSFVGTDSSIEVTNEYDIRTILSPYGMDIYRQDGTVVNDFRLLPSAYFTVEPVYEDAVLTGFSFRGGGYGHGVGMSQNGANEMAKQGYNYYEILNYYYEDFILEKFNK